MTAVPYRASFFSSCRSSFRGNLCSTPFATGGGGARQRRDQNGRGAVEPNARTGGVWMSLLGGLSLASIIVWALFQLKYEMLRSSYIRGCSLFDPSTGRIKPLCSCACLFCVAPPEIMFCFAARPIGSDCAAKSRGLPDDGLQIGNLGACQLWGHRGVGAPDRVWLALRRRCTLCAFCVSKIECVVLVCNRDIH